MPGMPLRAEAGADGGVHRYFDASGDGVADCAEICGPDGRLTALAYDPEQDGAFADRVEFATAQADAPALWIILDSIPYAMVGEAVENGQFPAFGPPTRIISPFPVMTDPCLAEFFGCSPSPGVESLHYDGERLTRGFDTYTSESNSAWVDSAHYALDAIYHGLAYKFPHMWCRHELKRIRETFLEMPRPLTIGYMMSTSGLGAGHGREGHAFAIELAARMCRRLLFETRGRVRITLMSDHGHAFAPAFRRLRVGHELAKRGFSLRDRLDGPDDVVVPEFGAVSCVAVHTRDPARVARACVEIEGVELATYRDDDRIVVLSAAGRASIRARRDAEGGLSFRYEPEAGDPLELRPLLERLAADGQLPADGYVFDDVLFELTRDHLYPDALARLWRAFDGLFVHAPQVLLSLAPGYYGASNFIDAALNVSATHGDLRADGSSGFVLSTDKALPPVVRMADLRELLEAEPEGRDARRQGVSSSAPPN